MRKLMMLVAGLAALTVPVLAVQAHSGSGTASVAVEPAAVTAGATVVFAGTGLEPDSDRVLVLAGAGLVVEFGPVKTDASGTFSKELTIPGHLPSGSYELRAIGDETLTATLAVTAAAGGATSGSGTVGSDETVVARARSPLELAAILAFVLATLAAGLVVAWRAERFGRRLRPGAPA